MQIGFRVFHMYIRIGYLYNHYKRQTKLMHKGDIVLVHSQNNAFCCSPGHDHNSCVNLGLILNPIIAKGNKHLWHLDDSTVSNTTCYLLFFNWSRENTASYWSANYIFVIKITNPPTCEKFLST